MTGSVTDKPISVAPEWAPQKAIWTAWPAYAREWNGDLGPPRHDVTAMVHALAEGNRVRLLANGAEAEASARAAVGSAAEIVPARYGDIWLRDTAPIFARTRDGTVALRFKTNSWGGKFDLPDDATVGDDIARLAGVSILSFDFVLEGGAVEHDGEGTILATRQTLLNANRNGWTKAETEAALRQALGAKKVIWIDEGLKNDHTDGHIDNVARFVGPAKVACQSPAGAHDDPNADTLDRIARDLEQATDAKGRRLEVIRIPSPGLYRNALGEIAPASHLNFVIANGVVVVPVYWTPTEAAALDALQAVFPSRTVIGVPSRGLLGAGDAGGGSFHCITQQEPA
jgi:agmatine deiminase